MRYNEHRFGFISSYPSKFLSESSVTSVATSSTLPSTSEFTLPDRFHTDRRSPWRWVLSHAARNWHLWLLALAGSITNAVAAGWGPQLIGSAFNFILSKPSELTYLGTIALLIAISQGSRGFLQLMRNFSFELLAQRAERDVRDELYTSLLGKSMTFHSLQPVGDTMARATNDVREVNFMFSPGFNMVIGSLTFLVMPLIMAPRYHPSLVATPIAFIIIYFILLRQYLKSLEPVTDEVRVSFGALNMRLAEALDGIEVVKGSAQEANEKNRFARNATRFRDAAVKQGDIEARFLPLLMLSIALAAGLLHAVLLYRQGLLQLGDVVGYFGLLLMLDFPTFSSIWAYSRIALGLAGARRILEVINRENNLDQNAAGFKGPMRGEITFDAVNFSYAANEQAAGGALDLPGFAEEGSRQQKPPLGVVRPAGPIETGAPDDSLAGLSFSVPAGKTVAIVGQTGSGKTTLARLVNRTYDVGAGSVRVDGMDVREWNLETLRRGISIIEQDIFLFSSTIAENIAFGQPDATPEQIEAAAKAAQAHDFIMSFKDGYQTVVGERGVTLSGGQRQRIALARAFLTDPRILILDDSTSAIDSATEDKIQRAIYQAAKGRTTLIITHRLSQIRWADLIVVLRQGRIAAIGTHDELLGSSEAYRRIFAS